LNKTQKTIAPRKGVPNEPQNNLQLRRVTLFKSGIGCFEKEGSINFGQAPQQIIPLPFKANAINDLLKTFSIHSLSGDLTVSGVSLEGEDTDLSKMLEESAINLPTANTFDQLLRQLRGVEVKLELVGGEQLQGIVVGLQSRQVAPAHAQVVLSENLLMLSEERGSVRILPSEEIIGLDIVDPTIRADFQYFMEVVAAGKKQKTKTLSIFVRGTQESTYLLRFLQAVPAWKVSYRLLMDEGEGTDLNAILQVWAIVDNVLDEDWNNVNLTLVSGLPVSFNYDSWSHQWIKRPVVARKQTLDVQVVQFDQADEELPMEPIMLDEMDMMVAMPPMAPMAMAPSPTRAARPRSGGGSRARAESRVLKPQEEQAKTTSSTGVGFQYEIPRPVVIKRNQSSLIQIAEVRLPTKLVSVYNEAVNSKHPMLSAEVRNTTGLVLEEGPISLFKGDIFAGEAMLPFYEKEELRRIPYAIDLSVEVVKSVETQGEKYHRVHIGDSIRAYYFYVEVVKYRINNHGSDARKVLLEHPKGSGYELFDTETPIEDTENYHRFLREVGAKKAQELVVSQRREIADYVSLTGDITETLQEWVRLGLIKTDEQSYLMQLLQLTLDVNRLEARRTEITNEIAALNGTQDRLRNNIKSLQTSTQEQELRQKYVTKLDEGEAAYERLQAELRTIAQEIEATTKKIDDHKKKRSAMEGSN
jgi:cell fate (sporulation/competence/biofilm development) regulator YlbF (YheA/YmcA/DUF963 family)